jgi:hypothetical protein
MAYVYRHIRNDKNQVFYVGIGSDKYYSRAYTKWGRNKLWKNIVEKTEYVVEILFNDISWDDACKKEIEFIKLYGRKDIQNGTLVNLTDGGQGAKGIKRTDKHKKILSDRMKGKKLSLGLKRTEEHKKRISIALKEKKHSLGCKRTEEHKKKISQGVKNAYLQKIYDIDFERAKLLLGE